MAKPKRMGRPPKKDPHLLQLNLRINREFARAAKGYQRRHKLPSVGGAVKAAAARTFDAEGF